MTHSSTDMEDAQRQAILAKLTEFNARCEALIALLADKRHVTHYDRTELEARYRSLKDDFKHAAATGTVTGEKRWLRDLEVRFYGPAIMKDHP